MINPSDAPYLPEESGCYLFKDNSGKIIYVGKAKNLRKRVSSYFQKRNLDPKTSILVSHIKDIDFIITKTEVEALLLENNLIKRYYPQYNLDLKDSRRYAYLLIHQGELPWIEVARSREEKGEYYGPFVSGLIRKLVMEVLTRNFRILTRKPSPRLKKIIVKEDYLKRVEQARQILRGNVDELIDELEKQMHLSSQKTYYEYALTLRNQVNALKTLKEKQIIELTRSVDANIINYLVVGSDVYLLVFSIRKGVLEGKQEFSFAYQQDFLNEFLLRYYDFAPIPQEVIIPHEVDPALAAYLTRKSRRKVSILIPQKGDKKNLLELVATNIKSTFFAGSERMTALQEALQLPKLPQYIECFDISHLGGTNTVASMVTFTNGIADKSNYRKFKIQSVSEGDDYLAMKEVVKRRYGGSLRNNMKFPDLIVIDGGPGQLSAALSSLKELKVNASVIALAKRLEEVYIQSHNNPIRIDRKNKGLQLLQAIRDEAHRFALSYQRLLRSKNIKGK